MTVEELFRQLSYGELSNLSIAVDATGTIKKAQQNRVIHFTNEALRALHARFQLLDSSTLLTIVGEEISYSLPENTLQVLAILTEQGRSLPFTTNVNSQGIYVHTGILYIPVKDLPYLEQNSQLQILLQLRHPILNPIVEGADLQQEISLLPELHKALTAYIAAEMYGSMNTADAMGIAANHRARYETVCLEALSLGLVPSEIRPNQKFEARGWI